MNFNLFSRLRGEMFISKSFKLYPDSLLPIASECFRWSSNSFGTSSIFSIYYNNISSHSYYCIKFCVFYWTKLKRLLFCIANAINLSFNSQFLFLLSFTVLKNSTRSSAFSAANCALKNLEIEASRILIGT